MPCQDFDLCEARRLVSLLALPWRYDPYDDQIVCENMEAEYGDYGEKLAQWHEQICQYLGEKRSKQIIEAVNLLPLLLDEIEKSRGDR